MNGLASSGRVRALARPVTVGRSVSVHGGRILGAGVAFAFTWLVPGLAMACTVCMGGQEEASRKAFIGTTAFLTFFPLLMLGLCVGWFVRRTLAQEREEEAARHAAELPQSSDRNDPLHAA